jgi:hypothetical protein
VDGKDLGRVGTLEEAIGREAAERSEQALQRLKARARQTEAIEMYGSNPIPRIE